MRDFGFTKTLFILQVEYFAAWPVLKKLARMMQDLYGRMIQPVLTEEDFEKFRRTIEAISPQMVRGGDDKDLFFLVLPIFQVDQVHHLHDDDYDWNNKENLAQIAARYGQTGFLQILLEHG